jgi:hypothetical protein
MKPVTMCTTQFLSFAFTALTRLASSAPVDEHRTGVPDMPVGRAIACTLVETVVESDPCGCNCESTVRRMSYVFSIGPLGVFLPHRMYCESGTPPSRRRTWKAEFPMTCVGVSIVSTLIASESKIVGNVSQTRSIANGTVAACGPTVDDILSSSG